VEGHDQKKILRRGAPTFTFVPAPLTAPYKLSFYYYYYYYYYHYYMQSLKGAKYRQ